MDIREHNKQYLGLNDEQYDEHCRLMETSDWADDLREYVKGVTQRVGACGDVIACAVVDWLKNENTITA